MLDRFQPQVLESLRALLAEAQEELAAVWRGCEAMQVHDGKAHASIGRSFVLKAWGMIRDREVLQSKMMCFKHGGLCNAYPGPEERDGKLLLAIGGNTCTPWSRMGQRRGWVREATRCFLLWVRELLEHKPHVVVQECTSDFDSDMFSDLMGEDYWVRSVVTNPSEQGHACTRPRKYSILVRRTALQLPPWGHDDYMGIAGDGLFGDASMYFMAKGATLDAYKKKLARQRHLPTTIQGFPVPWVQLISCSCKRRLMKYLAMVKRTQLKKKTSCFLVADLQQEPKFFGEARPRIPSLLRASNLYGWCAQEGIAGRHSRPLLPSEYLMVQALPVHMREHPQFRHMSAAFQREDILASLGDSAVRQLAGNGMNVAQVGAALLFAVCGPSW